MNYSIFDLLKLLGSLALFLFGMKLMSESLQKVAGDRMRNILSAMTSTRFKGIFTGFLITALIQSSSATTVMLVSFVNAGLVTFIESIGVIMGSNIGTTVTAWLISLLGFKIEISLLVLPLMGLSLPLIFSKNTNRSNWGGVIIGFAIIFIGLDFLNHSTPDIHNNPEMLSFLSKYSDYGYGSILIFLLLGTILTMLIQSSSAMMALTLVMCFNGWISFEMSAAMVLGQNIGTTITANLAALVANTSAKRTALAHLFFNIIGVILVMPFLYPFLHAIGNMLLKSGFHSPFTIAGQSVKETSAAIPVALSIFHSTFNILNTLILVWFVAPLEKIITRIIKIKDDEEEYTLKFITTGLLSTAELSILQAKEEMKVYAQHVEKMFFYTRDLIQVTSSKKMIKLQQKIKKCEEISDQIEVEISSYLAKVSEQAISQQATENINKMLYITTNIESIADSCNTISNAVSRKSSNKIIFTNAMQENLVKFSDLIGEIFCLMIGSITDNNLELDQKKLKSYIQKVYKNHEKLQQEHFRSLRKGSYKTKVGVIYADIYSELAKMGEYAYRSVEILATQNILEIPSQN